MAGTSELEALKILNSEIDESQIKVLASTQCIKAQAYLVNKLKKKAEQYRERCSFIFTANLKLQSEITQSQQEITSLLIAQDTIKNANVELKKEFLIAKEKKLQVVERVTNGEKKYEDMWLESKARYESLPFVQKLLKTKDEAQNIKQQTNELETKKKLIYEEMQIKAGTCREIDRKQIIAFAEFMAVKRPKYIELIKEKSAAITNIAEELDHLEPKTVDTVTNPDDGNDSKADNDCTSIMPKLQLNYLDFDNLNANLDKIKADDPFTKTPEKTYSVHSIIVIDPSKVNKKTPNSEEYISSFFYNPINKYGANKTDNYAKKKLINILGDIKIDKKEAQRMIAGVDPEVLQPVNSISVDGHHNVENNNMISDNRKRANEEEIEEVDLTASSAENMLMPPSQFIDLTPEFQFQSAPKESPKRQSTIKLKNVETKPANDVDISETEEEITNQVIDTAVDRNDDGLAKINDVIQKTHNLDLTPEFVYAKNTMTTLNLEKPKEAVVTSNFFPQEENQKETGEPGVVETINEDQAMTATEVIASPEEINNKSDKVAQQYQLPMEGVSRTEQKVTEFTQAEKERGGSLFGQCTQMTSDFLEESANTSVFEDDFPSCLDSILLSPKADLSLPNCETQEVLSQDVPNFLTGMRKTGLSFFGRLSSESKPDSSSQNQNEDASGFTFNFGGEKKTRGGLFSMFQ